MRRFVVHAGYVADGELGDLEADGEQSDPIIGGVILKFERYMLCHCYTKFTFTLSRSWGTLVSGA